jgi:DNA-binding protein
LSDSKKSKDAEDILSEFQDSHSKSEPQLESPEPEPQLESPEPEPQLESPEPEPQLDSPEPEPQLESPEPEPQLESPEPDTKSSERDVVFVGTKPIMTYVSATLTQLSTQNTVTIKARGRRITQAVDVSQMIVKRMDTVGYVISDVRISSDSLTSQDGKNRNVSTIEIDITKK